MIDFGDPKRWTVTRQFHEYKAVFIRPDHVENIARWIANVRPILPVLHHQSPAKLLAEVRLSGGLNLGTVSGREAHRMTGLLRNLATIIEITDVSRISYFPTCDGAGLIIEDESEAEAFCLKLIEEGAELNLVEG